MSDLLEEKSKVIREVASLRELMTETHRRFAALPRSTTASRQLFLIIAKMDQWIAAFGPSNVVDMVPDKDEIVRVLRSYNRMGNGALTRREQFVLQWLDQQTDKRKAG